MSYKVFPVARERIDAIWDYTEQAWNEDQADRYILGLFEAFDQIETMPHRWRPIQDPKLSDIYAARYEHHLIFFRELPSGAIGFITVLHESMNLPDRLKDDLSAGL